MNPSTEEGEGSGQQQQQQQQQKNASEDKKSQDTAGKAKEAPPGPSDVYLDVKSTHDGIQLIIRIPTVFRNG
ncbi:uncharacterized protein TrAtP1_007287 [Trichoderma atroviride]|uniref:uncharacterized protein n=1 Tax=Hypocrea atroviridis TaxID=63577 RepID=UPI0033203A17|nr:hypothetical protein TrAtP1_007287 [Trichoderma atroviride]